MLTSLTDLDNSSSGIKDDYVTCLSDLTGDLWSMNLLLAECRFDSRECASLANPIN